MAEKEQARRHHIEAQAMQMERDSGQAERGDFRRGQWMGFLLSVGCIAGSLWSVFIHAQHPTVSIALVGVPVMGAVKALLKR